MAEPCQHTPCPSGYVQWHYWADQMSKTHKQVRCPGCGLLSLWVPKPKRAKQAPKGEKESRK